MPLIVSRSRRPAREALRAGAPARGPGATGGPDPEFREPGCPSRVIYAVISYSVSQRSREIGIRMALGARPTELTRMFVGHGVVLATIGTAFGLLGALGLGRVMSSLLFRVGASDPLTLGLVAATLVAAAGLASYVPARRVADVDPAAPLRAE